MSCFFLLMIISVSFMDQAPLISAGYCAVKATFVVFIRVALRIGSFH